MICVKKSNISLCHQLFHYRILINWYKGKELKLHKLAILVLLILYTKDQVLCTDTMASFNIKSRFIRSDHSSFQNTIIMPLRHHTEADAIWSFVNI